MRGRDWLMTAMIAAIAWTYDKIQGHHRDRLAVVYVRQSTLQQVNRHPESTRLQYGLVDRALPLGWPRAQILVIDDDLGKSGATAAGRPGFQRLVAEVSLGHGGLVLGIEMSRLARSCSSPADPEPAGGSHRQGRGRCC